MHSTNLILEKSLQRDEKPRKMLKERRVLHHTTEGADFHDMAN